jgi:hypothetical protein
MVEIIPRPGWWFYALEGAGSVADTFTGTIDVQHPLVEKRRYNVLFHDFQTVLSSVGSLPLISDEYFIRAWMTLLQVYVYPGHIMNRT